MVIIIIGNIASGKSTLAKRLAEAQGMNIVCIDDKRNQLFEEGVMSYMKRERSAEKLVLEGLLDKACIYESTGVTQFYKRAYNQICKQHEKLVKIKLKCSQDRCFLRYNKRKFDGYFQAPFPFKKGKNIKESIRHIHWALKDVDVDLELDGENLTDYDVERIKQFING